MNQPEIKVLPDPDAVAREAAERIVIAANEAIEDRGGFTIALAGGSTPKRLYELLASEAFRAQIDWTRGSLFRGRAHGAAGS